MERKLRERKYYSESFCATNPKKISSEYPASDFTVVKLVMTIKKQDFNFKCTVNEQLFCVRAWIAIPGELELKAV